MSIPTDLMIFSPPTLVPTPIDRAAYDHQPDRDDHALHAALPIAEGHAQKQHADELLAVLGAVHEAHGGGAEDLARLEEAVGLMPVHPGADNRNQLADHPPGQEAQGQAQKQAVDDLDPLVRVDPVQAAVDGDGRAGEAGNQTVALTGGDAEVGGPHAVHHDGEQSRAQGDLRLVGIASKVHHVADGGGHRAVDVGHDEHAQEVEDGAGNNGLPGPQAAGGDAGGNGVGRVGPAIDEDDPRVSRTVTSMTGLVEISCKK